MAFFLMSFATSLPNLFVDINAAFQKIPQLAFGDIIGGNIFDLTVAVGFAVLVCNISLPAESRIVQRTALFTFIIAILPLFLIFDGSLDRIDGLLLLLAFFIYSFWLFFRDGNFKKAYRGRIPKEIGGISKKDFLRSFGEIILFVILLLVGSQGMIFAAKEFSSLLNIGLPVVGMLIVGIGNCSPETYFSIVSAKRNQNWMILGNLMGSVIVCSTLLLGLVVLIRPIEISNFSPFVVARIFTIVAATFFIILLKTGNKITKKEGILLILIYFAFLAAELYLY